MEHVIVIIRQKEIGFVSDHRFLRQSAAISLHLTEESIFLEIEHCRIYGVPQNRPKLQVADLV